MSFLWETKSKSELIDSKQIRFVKLFLYYYVSYISKIHNILRSGEDYKVYKILEYSHDVYVLYRETFSMCTSGVRVHVCLVYANTKNIHNKKYAFSLNYFVPITYDNDYLYFGKNLIIHEI